MRPVWIMILAIKPKRLCSDYWKMQNLKVLHIFIPQNSYLGCGSQYFSILWNYPSLIFCLRKYRAIVYVETFCDYTQEKFKRLNINELFSFYICLFWLKFYKFKIWTSHFLCDLGVHYTIYAKVNAYNKNVTYTF